jgi:F-type H+-transporting ATPase subunit epsilon
MTKLRFSLVAPERELYAGEVDQVDAPGAEGDFGVLFGHEPFMTTLRPGEVIVRDGATRRVFTIQGGFADVTPESFTILAESAAEATAH